MSVPLEALAERWVQEAKTLRTRYKQDDLASVFEVCAGDLKVTLRRSLDEQLSLTAASKMSGYSKSHLRRLMDEGGLPNVGEKGAPRVRVRDLPFKPGRMIADRAVQQSATEKPGTRQIRLS